MANSTSRKSPCIFIVGGTGSGKTTLAYKMTKAVPPGANKVVYDINEEEIWEDDPTVENVRGELPEDFINAIEGVPGVYVFEDATGFIDRSQNKQLRRMLVKKRHTPQAFIFIFHSLSQVPSWVLMFVDEIWLGKTTDKLRTSKEFNFPEIETAFEEIRKSNEKYIFKQIKLR
jgi:hypothetical protein